MPTMTIGIPTSLKIALDTEIAHVGGDESGVITTALAAHLGTPVHTLFQSRRPAYRSPVFTLEPSA